MITLRPPAVMPRGSARGMAHLSAILALILLLTACGGDSTPPQPAVTQTSAPAETPSAGSASPGSTAEPDAAGPLPDVRLQRVFPGLGFSRMTGLYQAPDGRFFVLEQLGRILVFEDRPDVSESQVFLDIRSKVDASGGEMGLLGFALAPDFAQSGVFYVDYTAGNPRRTVVSRFTASGATADPANESIILEVGQPFANHNGGQIAFGPDGFLYIALGDGGSQRDPQGNGQNLNALLGKILRIDVSGSSGDRAYSVPADNPFAGRGGGVREEVWAYGFRNPWRFSFDRQTGQLWAGDVGQNSFEEVDLVTKGGNYGWNVMEGEQCLGGGSCNRDGLTLPVIDYPTSGGNCSVTGGFVYRGNAIPALRGAYVYADYCGGHVWGLRYDGSRVTEEDTLVPGAFAISSFAQTNTGELYVLNYTGSGGIYQLVP
ncbi:MAG: glucose sorbosone dehydrogenase [Dehalococcoidia bacterium]|nr:glucose sorbosone dehydrogenase [Dehalococcoidia bacterium]